MLQVYILRTKQKVDEQDGTEDDDENDDTQSPKALFQDLLLFWRKTREIPPKIYGKIDSTE